MSLQEETFVVEYNNLLNFQEIIDIRKFEVGV